MKVVLDTNVVLSALLFDGSVSQVHKLWKSGEIIPVASKVMLEEYAKVMSYKKFSLTEEEVAAIFDEEIFPYFTVVRISPGKIPFLPADADDVPFLRAALDGGTSFVVSGDTHLLALNGRYEFPVVSPSEFLKREF